MTRARTMLTSQCSFNGTSRLTVTKRYGRSLRPCASVVVCSTALVVCRGSQTALLGCIGTLLECEGEESARDGDEDEKEACRREIPVINMGIFREDEDNESKGNGDDRANEGEGCEERQLVAEPAGKADDEDGDKDWTEMSL